MITEEIYIQLLEKAARACGEEQPEEAIRILTSGGIPLVDAREKIHDMMEAGPAIRQHQQRDRELIRLRDQVPDGHRCIVVTTNGITSELAMQEARHIWKTIVKEALADSAFNAIFCQGMDPTPLAVQAVGKADLFIFILSDQARELDWLQSQAQTLGKPIVPLVSSERDIQMTLPLLSAPIYYTCTQSDKHFEVENSASLIDTVKRRILEPEAGETRDRYDITRQIYREPLRTVGAQSVRDTICTEKLRSLHELHLSLDDALQRMDADYELSHVLNASSTSLAPFGDILTESAAIYQYDYQCLHKAMRNAVGGLPKSQHDESLQVCERMKALLQELGDFIHALQMGDASVLSRDGRNAAIETLQAEIRACCWLIPDRDALVKSTKPVLEDPLGSIDELVKQNTVLSTFDRALNERSLKTVKDFCRAIRSALLRWLALDRRTPGAYDEAATHIQSYGKQLHTRLAPGNPADAANEVWAAISQHVDGFDKRLKLGPQQRAAQDYDALIQFVRRCGE